MRSVVQDLVSREKFGAYSRSLNQLSKRLERLQRQEHPDNLDSIRQVQGEINKLLEMEDVKWRQRAKRNWFKDGGLKYPIFPCLGESTHKIQLYWVN
jgi:hypothetical protein